VITYTNSKFCIISEGYYTNIKIFNTLPASTAELMKNKKQFESVLKRFLIVESVYSINEHLNYKQENDS